MLEVKVALLTLAVALGQTEADEDTADTADVTPAAPEAATPRTPAIRYQFAQTNRVEIASGKTRVSAESGFVAPQNGYAMLRVFIDNTSGPRQTIELQFRANGAPGGHTVKQSVEVLEGERREVLMPVMAQMRSGQVTARGPGLTEGGESSVYFTGLYGSQQAMVSFGESANVETFLDERPEVSGADTTIGLLKPSQAPTEPLSYLGLDGVVLPMRAVFAQFSEAQRTALEQWVATGGRLMTPDSPALRQTFAMVKQLKPGKNAYGFGELWLVEGQAHTQWWPEVKAAVDPWGAPPAYLRHSGGLGDVLLPQATAPIGRFLLIIFLFTMVIGPGSVSVARRRGPAALLLFIPATALATCVLIVGYSAVADGFSVHAATYGYTWLDPARHRALTVGVTGYYANLSPRGAQFSASSGLVGSSSQDHEATAASYALSNGQQFGSDFLPSRAYREWGVVAVEPTRARLSLAKKGDQWVVRNALGADLEWVLVGIDGRQFSARSLNDGAEAPLKSIEGPLAGHTRADSRFSLAVTGAMPRGPDDGQFMAQVEGAPLVPTGGLAVQMHSAQSVIMGEVER